MLIGPNILVWGANFFLKEPRSDAYVSWHQDATYWGLEPADIVTAWVAFTPSTVESGCMRVVPGTHQGGIVEHRETWDADNLLSRGQEIAVEVDVEKVVDVVLKPGEMSLHHVKIAHNSEPNRSAQRRDRLRHPLRRRAREAGRRRTRHGDAGPRRATCWNYFDHEEGARGEFLPEDLERHAQSWGASRLVPAKPAKAS